MAVFTSFAAALLLARVAHSQGVGPSTENHPRLTTWKCTKADGCKELNTAVVLDALAHPVYQKNNRDINCGNWGEAANATVCPDLETCQENCIMDGIPEYEDFGIFADKGKLTLKQLKTDGSLASPRVYLLAEDKMEYEMIKLTGQEFSFQVDASKLPCGMNGALYMSEMEENGGMSKLNTGGAYYGTGYCDAQCFTTPFINGEANLEGAGSCCNELDIWEANGRATHLAPHPCNKPGLYKCKGSECQFDGVCDKNGCGYNPYKVGNKDYYGPGKTVDTRRPFTVVTQFPAGSDGKLKEIHRLYVQDGKVIKNAPVKLDYAPKIDFMNDELCSKTGASKFMSLGATAGMGAAMTRGMVLAFSIWWDEGTAMEWLDGGDSGPCQTNEGLPSNIVKVERRPSLVFKDIKWGEIDSTYKA